MDATTLWNSNHEHYIPSSISTKPKKNSKKKSSYLCGQTKAAEFTEDRTEMCSNGSHDSDVIADILPDSWMPEETCISRLATLCTGTSKKLHELPCGHSQAIQFYLNSIYYNTSCLQTLFRNPENSGKKKKTLFGRNLDRDSAHTQETPETDQPGKGPSCHENISDLGPHVTHFCSGKWKWWWDFCIHTALKKNHTSVTLMEKKSSPFSHKR